MCLKAHKFGEKLADLQVSKLEIVPIFLMSTNTLTVTFSKDVNAVCKQLTMAIGQLHCKLSIERHNTHISTFYTI